MFPTGDGHNKWIHQKTYFRLEPNAQSMLTCVAPSAARGLRHILFEKLRTKGCSQETEAAGCSDPYIQIEFESLTGQREYIGIEIAIFLSVRPAI